MCALMIRIVCCRFQLTSIFLVWCVQYFDNSPCYILSKLGIFLLVLGHIVLFYFIASPIIKIFSGRIILFVPIFGMFSSFTILFWCLLHCFFVLTLCISWRFLTSPTLQILMTCLFLPLPCLAQ